MTVTTGIIIDKSDSHIYTYECVDLDNEPINAKEYDNLDSKSSDYYDFLKENLSHVFQQSFISKNNSENSQWIKNLRFLVSDRINSYQSLVKMRGESEANIICGEKALSNWYEMFSYEKAGIEENSSENECASSENIGLRGIDLIYFPLVMTSNINVRDAMLISILDDYHEWYEYKSLYSLAFEPHTKVMSQHLRDCLESKFTYYDHIPDIRRVNNAIDVLTSMAYIMSGYSELTAHIYALIAYLRWWFSLGKVERYVNLALNASEDCSMARIVKSAYENGVEPQWLKKDKIC